MLRRTLLTLVALLPCALLDSCQASGGDGPTYDGPRPSVQGVFVLRELAGEKLPDVWGAFGGGDWTIGRYAVIANPVSEGGVGPVIRLEKGSRVQWLPIETDGDVADLYRRVHKKDHPDVADDEVLSAAYQAAWKV